MATHRRPWVVVVLLIVVALVLWLAWLRSPSLGEGQARPGEQTARSRAPLAGTPSCSARGCHGSIEPAVDPARCQQNEYTTWMHDKHADAFQVLFTARSQDIARLLGDGKKAHDDPRCLACHTNPALAALLESSFVREERQFGVGCESCHGSASTWLVAHTAADWRQKKHAYAMPDLNNPAVAAKACVGCHVGAASFPVRDVNHDLIAAGHPRLNFEFGSYLANMPAHWRAKPRQEGHVWAVGQVVAAEAALDLLTHRAKSGPWPEFAEYDCFACHHSLTSPSLRQASKPVGRAPGALPWGSWYFALIDETPELRSLRTTMQKPSPNRGRVLLQVLAAHDKLKVVTRLDALVGRHTEPSWDAAEQTYLALHALNHDKSDPAVVKLLGELTPLRAFSPGLDGPVSSFDARGFFERVRKLK